MEIKTILCIDPGKSNGGIAVYSKDRRTVTYKMPATIKELIGVLKYHQEIDNKILCAIEYQQVFAGDVTSGFKKSFHMRKLLDNFNMIKNAFELVEIEYLTIHPTSWQSYLRLRLKIKGDKEKESDKDRKNRYKRFAQNCFQDVKVTLRNSDALCMCEFLKRKLRHEPEWITNKMENKQPKMLM